MARERALLLLLSNKQGVVLEYQGDRLSGLLSGGSRKWPRSVLPILTKEPDIRGLWVWAGKVSVDASGKAVQGTPEDCRRVTLREAVQVAAGFSALDQRSNLQLMLQFEDAKKKLSYDECVAVEAYGDDDDWAESWSPLGDESFEESGEFDDGIEEAEGYY